jgi:hypothetical protein
VGQHIRQERRVAFKADHGPQEPTVTTSSTPYSRTSPYLLPVLTSTSVRSVCSANLTSSRASKCDYHTRTSCCKYGVQQVFRVSRQVSRDSITPPPLPFYPSVRLSLLAAPILIIHSGCIPPSLALPKPGAHRIPTWMFTQNTLQNPCSLTTLLRTLIQVLDGMRSSTKQN